MRNRHNHYFYCGGCSSEWHDNYDFACSLEETCGCGEIVESDWINDNLEEGK